MELNANERLQLLIEARETLAGSPTLEQKVDAIIKILKANMVV